MEQDAVSMKIKSYFSNSVEKAIQEARQEMGPEAMLLTTRRSSPERGVWELTKWCSGCPQAQAATPPSVRSTVDLSSELQSLQSQLEEVKSALQLASVRPACFHGIVFLHGGALPGTCRRRPGTRFRSQASPKKPLPRGVKRTQTPRSIRGGAVLRQLGH